MINRRIIITENQFSNLFHNGQLITENRASKNQSLARRMVRELSPNINDKDLPRKCYMIFQMLERQISTYILLS